MIANKELVLFHKQSLDITKLVVQIQIEKKSVMLGSINKIPGNEEHSGKETTQVKNVSK